MINFHFRSIWILSRLEKRARKIQFHPQKNLLIGVNHTGKSTLIKTLFLTIGAKPHGKLEKWDSEAISLVEFSVDSKIYYVVHQNGKRAIFNESGLIDYATNHAKWTQIFSGVVRFNLVLLNKDGVAVSADPKCFFIPYYINQDGSWTSKWDTFDGLQQYATPIAAILEYFSGVKPPKYYELDSAKNLLEVQLQDFQKESRFLVRARDRFEKALPISIPKINPENFEHEIEKLNQEMADLNKRQEALRDQAVRETEIVNSVRLQISLANDALSTYESDVEFIRSSENENLVCPTCGAEHSESFIDVLTYAEDARVLRELVVKLHDDLGKAQTQYSKTKTKLDDLNSNYKRISDLLDVRKGDLQFKDVINSMSAESAYRAFDDEEKILKTEVDKRLSEIESIDRELKNLTSITRSKEILQVFRQSFASSFVGLNMPSSNTSKIRLTSRPNISGSGGPRSVLAYYGALWRVCYGEYGSFRIPIVIDSPNQQGQDKINMPRVLQYISTELPSQAQIIVGSEVDTENHYDKKYLLTEKYKVLREEEYEEAEAFVGPFYDTMLRVITDSARI